ncbi:hypothetical protein CPB86DRAFT_802323 [Serendipita vermifera]|nr:hypothetical protein CPB86DRAFT_802323 [Serendipita vermifera]
MDVNDADYTVPSIKFVASPSETHAQLTPLSSPPQRIPFPSYLHALQQVSSPVDKSTPPPPRPVTSQHAAEGSEFSGMPEHPRPTWHCEPNGLFPYHPYNCDACFISNFHVYNDPNLKQVRKKIEQFWRSKIPADPTSQKPLDEWISINLKIMLASQEVIKKDVAYLLSRSHEYDNHLNQCGGVGKRTQRKERDKGPQPYPRRAQSVPYQSSSEVQHLLGGGLVPQPEAEAMVLQPTSSRGVSRLEEAATVLRPTSPRGVSRLEEAATVLRPTSPRGVSRLEEAATVLRPTPPGGVSRLEQVAVVSRPTPSREVPRLEEVAVAPRPTPSREVSRVNPPAADMSSDRVAPQAGGPLVSYTTVWEEIMSTFPGDTAEERVNGFLKIFTDPRHGLLQEELDNLKKNSLLPAQRYYLDPPEYFVNRRKWFTDATTRPLGTNQMDGRLDLRSVDVHTRLGNIFPKSVLKSQRNSIKSALDSSSWPKDIIEGGQLEIPFPANLAFTPLNIRSHLFTRCRWTYQYVHDVAEPYFQTTTGATHRNALVVNFFARFCFCLVWLPFRELRTSNASLDICSDKQIVEEQERVNAVMMTYERGVRDQNIFAGKGLMALSSPFQDLTSFRGIALRIVTWVEVVGKAEHKPPWTSPPIRTWFLKSMDKGNLPTHD